MNSAWEKVSTKPNLPVETGATVTFICPEGHNLEGSTSGICRADGEIQPNNETPKCLKNG